MYRYGTPCDHEFHQFEDFTPSHSLVISRFVADIEQLSKVTTVEITALIRIL